MNIPIDELHRRFRKKKATRRVGAVVQNSNNAPAAEAASPVGETAVVGVPKISHAQELAERQMLGILLREPHRWHQVGLVLHPEDFGDLGHRRLAEIYWQHQQDLGEPVFSEFIGSLDEPAMKELAVMSLELAEGFSAVDEMLNGALAFLEEEKKRRANKQHVAKVLQAAQENAEPEAQKKSFEEFLKNNQTFDPKRLGPIRRFRSGS
jgi:hypothetical protein